MLFSKINHALKMHTHQVVAIPIFNLQRKNIPQLRKIEKNILYLFLYSKSLNSANK